MDKMKKAPNLDGMVLCDPDKTQTLFIQINVICFQANKQDT
jgi:hypothetical protein